MPLAPLLLALIPFTSVLAQEPPPRAPLRETAVLETPDERFAGVLTLCRLSLLDQPEGTRRVDLDRLRTVGRSDGLNPSIVGETMALVTSKGKDKQLVLANLDAVVYAPVISRIKMPDDAAGSPFRRIELSPDKSMFAINPTEFGAIYPDPMFDDYKYDFQSGYLGTSDIVYLYDKEGSRVARFVGYYEPTWTQDGKLLMVGGGDVVDHGLYRADPETEEVERVDKELLLGAIYDPVVDPEGKNVAFQYQGQIWSMDMAGTKLTPLVRDPDFELVFPRYSPDGRSLAYLKRGSVHMVQGVFLIALDDIKREYFYDLRTVAADGSGETFRPFGPLLWTGE